MHKAVGDLVFEFAILDINVSSTFYFFHVDFGGSFYKQLQRFEPVGQGA